MSNYSSSKTVSPKYSTAGKVGWFFLSWFVTLLTGVVLCMVVLWLSAFMIGDYGVEWTMQTAGKFLLTYGFISCAVLLVSIQALRKFSHPYLRYTKIALWVGFGLNALVLLGGVIVAVITTVSYSLSDDNSSCRVLDLGQSNLLGATVPIMTDSANAGTAFAISAEGDYLTAYHVVEGAKSVFINTTEGRSPMKVVKSDPDLDIALLRGEKNQYPLRLTTRYEQADQVYALGYPENTFDAGFGSLSHGIISRLISNADLRLMSKETPEGLSIVQTDAAINPGNSGGPLVNKCGVVGVIISISSVYGDDEYGLESEQGISYAVSAQTIARRFGLPIQR